MDETLARIHDDLRGLVKGQLLFDELARALYSTDASIYQVLPLGVVVPRGVQDVVATVEYAAEKGIPLIPRGGGSGLAGEALGQGLVLDFTRQMRRIEAIGDEWVRVQPGVVLDDLNAALRPQGRMLGPDPASSSCCTVGGMLANNATGAHALKYGDTRDALISAQVVLANGDTVEVGSEPRTALRPDESQPLSFKAEVVRKVQTLLERNAELIARKRPRVPRNRAGYVLDGVLTASTVELGKLLVGSEGTLAIFTAATLRTVAVPQHRAVALLTFPRLDAAARAVLESLPYEPAACELLDRRLLTLAREAAPEYRQLLSDQAEAVLIVEQQAESPIEVRDRIRLIVHRLRYKKRLAVQAYEAFLPEEIERIWGIRKVALPMLSRVKGTAQPVPFIEDVAVPPEALPGFLVRLQNILKKHQVTASVHAHAGAGQLHTRPFLDLRQYADVKKLERIASEVYEAAFEVGGTISGQHAVGLVRTQFIKRQYGELYKVFRQVKATFDPQNLLNPGKIINDDPHLMVQNLRFGPAYRPDPGAPEVRWQAAERRATVEACNGCGACRTTHPGLRMCPSFRAERDEAAAPRAKANLARQMMAGLIDQKLRHTTEFKRIADLCIGCQMCRLECPTRVDIPRLVIDAKAGYVAQHGLTRSEWVMSRAELFERLGSVLSVAANWSMQSPPVRWLLEQVLDLPRFRKMPQFHHNTFLRRARRAKLTRRPAAVEGVPRVAYFVDLYANYNDPELGDAVVAVLRHQGVQVHVPPLQRACGMTLFTVGDLDAARDVARHNLHILSDLVREGYTIVCSEPTAALMLRREYAALLDDVDVQLVAAQTRELGQYLRQLHAEGRLRTDFRPLPLAVAYHAPCHLKALEIGTPMVDLLRLIPGLTVHTIDGGCSGMAGTFGMRRESFKASLRIGWPMIAALRQAPARTGTTECSTCKIQMEQAVSFRTVHPIKLLALAYGLMPRLARHLDRRNRALVVS